MIRVTCAQCGEAFEIGDDFAGITEFCPLCGALNDIPDSETEEDEPAPPAPVPTVEEPMPRGWGIPGGLWWGIFVAAVGCFIVACIVLFSDNWESRNVELLSDATNRGDDFLAAQDYVNAVAEYKFVLDTVGKRKIESSYIEQLIDRSQRGISDAQTRMRLSPATAPSLASAPATATTAPVQAEDTQSRVDLAMKQFQRNTEGFGHFVRERPIIFRDSAGSWRRRRYVVWDESYKQPALQQPLQISLSFSVGSAITEPHFSRADAAVDDNFIHEESPQVVSCEAEFEWSQGRWRISHQDVNAAKEAHVLDDVRPSLDDFFELEQRAFGVTGI